jgi:DeoR/GlpR family transcriptional regulator of sugar metabolism
MTREKVSLAQGITSRQVSDETIRRALKKLGENGKRDKKRISSPDPRYEQKGYSRPASPDLEGSPRLDVSVGR